jgi:hypothetical protein
VLNGTNNFRQGLLTFQGTRVWDAILYKDVDVVGNADICRVLC